jgi:hypothetical protein
MPSSVGQMNMETTEQKPRLTLAQKLAEKRLSGEINPGKSISISSVNRGMGTLNKAGSGNGNNAGGSGTQGNPSLDF